MVGTSKLRDAERLVDELDPADRIRLLQYLAPRIADSALPKSSAPAQPADESWQRLREVGERVAAAVAVTGVPSMTELVSEMRR